MHKNLRQITLFFILLIGVLGNVFAVDLVHDASKTSVEKSAVGCECIKAWEKILSSTDDGIKALRTNPTQLQKFSDIIASNNLAVRRLFPLYVRNAVFDRRK